MTGKAGSTFTAGAAFVCLDGSFRTLVRSGDEYIGRKIASTWVGMANPKRGPEESRRDYYARCRTAEINRARQNEANATLIAEAFNVAHETGLAPRQLAEQREAALSPLKNLVKIYNDELATHLGAELDWEIRAAIARAKGGAV